MIDSPSVLRLRMEKGFTLIELMVVVAIIGVLASIAMPAFSKQIRKSKTSEAYFNIRKIYDGEVAYYQEERSDSAGVTLSKDFVFCTCQPLKVPSGQKEMGNYSVSGWPSIRFNVDSPGYYTYLVETLNSPANPCPAIPSLPGYGYTPPPSVVNGFLARAFGDLNADGNVSEFARFALVNQGSDEIEGMGGVFVLDELE
jgi:prepilin-type N-terminal cleavage/methylation domain-containing protein